MSERFHPRYKRPKSRSEEVARYARAEASLARRLGEIPRRPTVSQRVRDVFRRAPSQEELSAQRREIVEGLTLDNALMIHVGEEALGADDFPYTQKYGPDLPSITELRKDAEPAIRFTDQFIKEPKEPVTLFQRARNVFKRNS